MEATARPHIDAPRISDPRSGLARQKAGGPRRLEFIDSLRGWAFIAVVIFHAGLRGFGSPFFLKITSQGESGVQLFFVISAATLFLSLTSRWSKDRYPYIAFFIRRFFRIAPMFWVAIAFYVWWLGTAPRPFAPDGVSAKDIAITAAFAHGWTPKQANAVFAGDWTVGVEMSFYLLVPFLFFFIKTMRTAIWFFLASILFGTGLSHIVHRLMAMHWPAGTMVLLNRFFYLWLPAQLPVFALGIVLFFILRRYREPHDLSKDDARVRSHLGWLLIACSALLVEIAASLHNPILKQHVAYGIAFVLLAWGLAMHPASLLVNRVTRYVGMVSYSGYLAQFFALDICYKLVMHFFGTAPLHGGNLQLAVLCASGLALTVAIASCFYHLVELPGQALGKLLIARIEAVFSSVPDAGYAGAAAKPGSLLASNQ